MQFFSPYLCERFLELVQGELFPTVTLGDVAEVGPLGRRIRDSFTRSSVPDAKGRSALWQHDTTVTQSMLGKPDTYIVAKPDKSHLADSYWEQRSRLLLPTHLRLNTIRIVTVRLESPVVSSLWVPCNLSVPKDTLPMWEKALCVFLNSSIGVLALLGDRTNKIPTRPNLSLDDLRKLLVPDFTSIGEAAIETLTVTYDALAEDVLLSLPRMDTDPVRRDMDDAVCTALGLDVELVSTVRRQLAAEPSVTGKRFSTSDSLS